MPYETTWTRQGVVKRCWGFLTGREFAESAEAIAADPRFDALRYIVNDCREVTGHGIDDAAIERIALTRIGSAFTNPNIRVAVVTSEPGLAALANIDANALLAGTQPTAHFEDLDAALAWASGNGETPASAPVVSRPR